jgi:hypothetical protein
MAKIDSALEYYHQRIGTAVSFTDQVDLLYSVFNACIKWLKKKEQRSEFTRNLVGMKTNYYDQNFLARRTVVRNLGNDALNTIYQILSANGILSVEAGMLKFNRNKLETLSSRQVDRPAVKSMEDSYTYERTSYLKSGKTQAISGSSIHGFHGEVARGAIQLPQLSTKEQAALNKNVDTLTPQDWIVLDALSKRPSVGYSTDVIYKKRQQRFEMMVSPDPQGRLLDSHDALFSTRQNQCGIFSMDRYGNLFVEPPDLKLDGKFFNHSSFNAGNDVTCAGEVVIDQGILTSINNASGHYKPTRSNLHECVKTLHTQGVNLTQAQVIIYGGVAPVTVNATGFLATG